MANLYTYPTRFVPDANSTTMKCPSCFRVLSSGEKLTKPSGYLRDDTDTISNERARVKHQRTFEHIDNLKVARLLDLGYTTKVRRRHPSATQQGAFTPEPLVFTSPLDVVGEAAHTEHRTALVKLWNAMLKFFATPADGLMYTSARDVGTPKTRATQELERYRLARSIEKAGAEQGTMSTPTWYGDDDDKQVHWPEAEPARLAWQMTGDPVSLVVRHYDHRRLGRRVGKHIWAREQVFFKRSAMDRLVEWSTLFMNELDRMYLATSKPISSGHRVPRDLLHILMVLSVPHEEGWGRTFSIYGSPGKHRTYLKHQPTGAALPAVIKL